MNRLLYEKSVSYRGHLIIPFVFGKVDGQFIYSYQLLSELGYRGKFHKAENPAKIYSHRIQGIVEIAREYLDVHSDAIGAVDYFQHRYTYRGNLIIVHQEAGKYFYDHYKPESLTNLAAPKIFQSEVECLNWIKIGLDRSHASRVAKRT